MPEPMYRCSRCNLAVIVAAGEVIKACNCDAPVIAEASASVVGAGGLALR